MFYHLFSKAENLVKLYKVFTGETITEAELQTVTLDSHLINQLYNDLAFIAQGKVLILLEAQKKNIRR